MPYTDRAIGRFEKQNPTISVSVFGYNKSVHSLRISKHERENQVDLLLISDEKISITALSRIYVN